MADRRNFLKLSVLSIAGIAGTTVMANGGRGNDKLPQNIIYSEDEPGRWPQKAGSHLPVITVNGKKVTVKTEHGMSEVHYIVRHTLVAENGDVIGEKTFYPTDEQAVSIFEIPDGYSKLYATSFCNKHDLWLTEFEL